LLAGSLFTIGIALFVWNFIQYGLPSIEAVGAPEPTGAAEGA